MENKTNTRIVTLKDLWDILIQRIWIIGLAAVISMVSFFVVDRIAFDPKYASTATMYILRQASENTSAGDLSSDFSLALKVVNDCTYLLKSHTVLDEVGAELQMEYEDLYDSISTKNPQDTRILEVTVKADTPELAKAIVDRVCQVGANSINQAMGFDQVNLYELGTTSDEPCNKTGLLVFLLVGAGVAVLTYAVFLLLFLLDDSIRTEEDIERYLGLSILGDIPDADMPQNKRYGYGGYGYGYGNRSRNHGAKEG